MAGSLLVTMVAGSEGPWRIEGIHTVCGSPLPAASRLDVQKGHSLAPVSSVWTLLGATGAPRYTQRTERDALTRVEPALGRPEATSGAMIALRKSDAWWSLAADERRKIFEEDSRHIEGSMRFLPAIARRLYHSRELQQPFDFLTWFEFAPGHAVYFDELVAQLRKSEEWRYVEREVDLRLTRDA